MAIQKVRSVERVSDFELNSVLHVSIRIQREKERERGFGKKENARDLKTRER